MKKIFNKIYTLLAVTAVVFIADSCLKDDRFVDFSKVGQTVEFLDAIPGKATAISFADPTSSVPYTLILKVNQTGPNATTKDITLQFGFSQAGLDMYNLDKAHVAGTALPTDAYSFPADVTIKAGKDTANNNNRAAQIKVLIYPNKVPPTPGVNYVLSLGITGAPSDVTISGNLGHILFNFYHNPYDGSYHRTGTLVRGTNPPDVINENVDLITVNSTTSSTIASFFGNPGLSFFVKVNADNSVDVVSDDAALYPITSNGLCSYNPGTKTFTMKYKYTSSASRVFTETWVHN